VNLRQTFDTALQHHRSGRLGEAEKLYRQILAAEPNHSDALHHLGLIAQQVGRHDLALELVRRALILRPDDPLALANLGAILRSLGRPDETIASLRRAVALNPELFEVHNNLGVALTEKNQFDEAVGALRRAIEIRPDYATAHFNLGIVLSAMDQTDGAIAAYRRTVEIDPRYPEAQTRLGAALRETGRFDDALAVFQNVVQMDPEGAYAHSNLGNALKDKGRLDEAIEAYSRAIALKPDDPDSHWNKAVTLLSLGRFPEGWEEFAWRLTRPHLARPDLTAPPWNGEDLAGKTLLIHQEGGFGDVIQFIRYLPMIRARGAATILFEGGAPLLPLMKIQPGIAETFARGQPLPPHDFHCPPQSFPRLFGTDLAGIPADVPYLIVDQEKRASWRRKLSGPPYQDGEQRQFLVGLCWAGSEQSPQLRSRTLSTFAPLAQVPNVTFVSLQTGKEAGQVADPPVGMKLWDAAAEVETFSDLAALVSCLDAVASVDTSVAHLAGALGIPTWILVPLQPDFRWMIAREDSPWYPTARLFRQQDFHSWDETVQRMAALLKERAEAALPSGRLE